MSDVTKILQICPAASGWRACFYTEHGGVHTTAVACWSLISHIEDDGSTWESVEGMVDKGLMTLEEAHTDGDLLGYVGPDEDPGEFRETAKHRAKTDRDMKQRRKEKQEEGKS